MREKIAPALAILLLAIVATTSYWYSQVLRRPQPVPRAAPGTPDFFVERVVITQFDALGRARHKLFADKLTHYLENDNIELASPRLVSLRPDQPQLDVRSRNALVEEAGERVHMLGSVVATRAGTGDEPPMRFTSEYLLALPDSDRFSTDQPVTMERGASTVRARAMQYDNITRVVDFRGDVRAVFAPGPSAKAGGK